MEFPYKEMLVSHRQPQSNSDTKTIFKSDVDPVVHLRFRRESSRFPWLLHFIGLRVFRMLAVNSTGRQLIS